MKPTFGEYLKDAVGSDNAIVAFSAFDKSASVSVRRNPFKKGCTLQGRQVPWAAHGLLLDERPKFTLDPAFHAGAYYVQDSSSMFVGHVVRGLLSGITAHKDAPVRVLDLCAAPGGKTTDLAASLREAFGDDFLLVANEVMSSRVGSLADNVALWGDPNVVVTSEDPRSFSSLEGYFDLILADVPCSGEGMFRKDMQAREQWSEDNVALCQARQRRIIADMWPSLKTGGFLVYSTCTFNRYENDLNVGWISEEMGAEVLSDAAGEFPGVLKTERGYSLVPGLVEGEGQYCAALRKTSDGHVWGGRPARSGRQRKDAFLSEEQALWVKGPMRMVVKGEMMTAVPDNIYEDVLMLRAALKVISAGCAIGTCKGKIVIPYADLALSMALDRDAFPSVNVDLKTALSYLHRDAILLPDAPKGYVLVCYENLPLGFVKNLGNRCNSLHPQGRRIRMDVSTIGDNI